MRSCGGVYGLFQRTFEQGWQGRMLCVPSRRGRLRHDGLQHRVTLQDVRPTRCVHWQLRSYAFLWYVCG
jgi:hypothetical protein